MSPIIGVIDSAKTGRLATGAYFPIATQNGTGSSSVISFTSIPSTYSHLQIRILGKDSGASTGVGEWYIRFNNDTTGANYWKERWYATGSSATFQNASVGGEGIWGTMQSRGGNLGMTAAIVDIHNYTGSKWKNIQAWGTAGYSASAVGFSQANGPWQSTSAINRIDIESNVAAWASNTVVCLYGVM